MIRIGLPTAISLTYPFLLAAQGPANYLGQSVPGTTVQLFAPGIVSTDRGELNAVFSSDLREFYFTRRGIPRTPAKIMGAKRGEVGWTLPEAVGFDERYSAIDLFLHPDGQSMIFCSNHPGIDAASPRPDHNFWISQRAEGGWGEPRPFAENATSDSEDYYPVVTLSGALYFNSQREGRGTNNIYRSVLVAGEYRPAVKMPAPINSEFREFDAWVSPDEDIIIFSSERPGGRGGADLYMSILADGKWSVPRNLGAAINSDSHEYGSVISPDGRYFFFTSDRGGSEDIYWVNASILRQPQP